MRFILILFLIVWASIYKGEAQTFFWESEPELCNSPYVKIKETKSGEFFIIRNHNCKVSCLKLNKYGNLIWQTSAKIFSGVLTDFISYDNDKSFYVIGKGGSFPSTGVLFQIGINGQFIFEREIFTLTYFPLYFNDKLYENKIVTCGYSFHSNPKMRPIIEFRSLIGDTLGKTEIESDINCRGQRMFSLMDKPGFLIFCGHYVSSFLTIIKMDTIGNKINEKVYGLGEDGYQTDFQDLMEKDSSYYLLAGLDFNKNNSGFERGTYIYRFNHTGDSISLNFIELNPSLKAIAPTNDNGFVIAGDVLIKLDSNYKEEWRTEFKKWVRITSVAQSLDGGYYGAGSVFDETINRNKTFVFKTDAKGNIDLSPKHQDIVIYPNPVKDELRIDLPADEEFSVFIFDLQGRKCLEFLTFGSTKVNLNIFHENVYMIIIKNSEGKVVKSQKVLKMNEL